MRRVLSESDVIRSENGEECLRLRRRKSPRAMRWKRMMSSDSPMVGALWFGRRVVLLFLWRRRSKDSPVVVEKDSEKAEEYYGRAILENPCDGEALSMYGKLIWETKRDEERAQGYFDQDVHASPDDCMVLGSYAHFM